uniref:ENTH domain-containing protein n=1 Tax=Nelumbo nucifera TaxID=4432 RepID=A0A822YHY2_NELNU|nr:TPA_asm: hypothetical protein HUJ06_010978 [Nelumbo nucifera]
MATLQTWRKAYGAIKDSTKVGLAKVNSEFKDVDVAIVKATNHVESPPKERHLRKILAATSVMRPRADVAYCIRALASRLAKTHNWTVCFSSSLDSVRMTMFNQLSLDLKEIKLGKAKKKGKSYFRPIAWKRI